MNKDLLTSIHARFELAARKYCAKTGMNPDEVFRMPSPIKPRIVGAPPPVVVVKRWQMVAEELYDMSCRLVSMQEAAAEVASKPKVVTQ